ncbi:MAG TPA: hypothetical protein VKS78_14620 [Roseiarcus sp.]|nr:hypothetical protein [Roseiarcus sp.]
MLQHIILQLARNPDFPEGSAECGYDIVAPLDATGHLSPDEWRTLRKQCRVRRFWSGQTDRRGMLVHHAGGAKGATWKLDYDARNPDDEDTGIHLDSHRFVENEYVSIRDEEGRPHTFKIVRVRQPGNGDAKKG